MNALPRVSAVSFLNTSPLVWGLLHGPQRERLDLRFVAPSECADDLRDGRADVGLAPIIELVRQPDLTVVPGCAIACQGPVRSILLVSKRPLGEIETLAADVSSRTSVVLSRLILSAKYGAEPAVVLHPPRLEEMLAQADAALVIGDPALRIDDQMTSWQGQPVHVYDLGAEWTEMTGLPMVFAVWTAKGAADPALTEIFNQSRQYGLSRVDEIVRSESVARGFPEDLVRRYLTEHLSYHLGPRERAGINRYLKLAAEAELAPQGAEARYLESTAIAGQEQRRC